MLRAGPAGFEDGTPNYLAAAAIPAGFALVDALGMERVHRHVTRLNTLLLDGVRNLLHSNGRALAVVYGPMDTCSRGATVAFNVLDREGSVIPFASVEAEARVARISIRGGCFCNPGAAERALGIRADDVSRCLDRARSEGFAQARFAECMKGRPLGALRASLGAPSNEADVHRLIELIAGWRDRRAE